MSGPLSSLARRRSTSSSRSLSGSTRASRRVGPACTAPVEPASRAAYDGGDAPPGRLGQQGHHRGTLAGEDAHVPLRLAQLEGAGQGGQRRPGVAFTLPRQREEDQDLQGGAMPAVGLGRAQQPLEEAGGRAVASTEEGSRERDVLELAQVVGLVGHRQPSLRCPRERLLGPALLDPEAGPHGGDGSNVG